MIFTGQPFFQGPQGLQAYMQDDEDNRTEGVMMAEEIKSDKSVEVNEVKPH